MKGFAVVVAVAVGSVVITVVTVSNHPNLILNEKEMEEAELVLKD